jgi:hypothetical protein
MPPEAEFEARPARVGLWRAVEAQHVAATMVLVDTKLEQAVLEDLLERPKPLRPTGTEGLHYLLFTPFRYPPLGHGSRFRGAGDPGVFYGAEAVRTACAELGYWRWRFLMASHRLPRLAPAPQTVFLVDVAGRSIDLREPPLVADRARWTDPSDNRACQRLGAAARAAGIELIRYESVRDPEGGGAGAVLAPTAFAEPAPLVVETWYLGVTRERVWWARERSRGEALSFEFSMPPVGAGGSPPA